MGEFTIPATPYPWRHVDHDEREYMVRIMGDTCWVQRLPDRAIWCFEPLATAPDWCRLPAIQQELF